MFRKLFRRPDATLATPELGPPVPPVVTPTASAPETLKERRNIPRPLPTPEVIEGDGGHTDWDVWTEEVKKSDEGVSFAETVPMWLGPK
jgi:hypothetical protein